MQIPPSNLETSNLAHHIGLQAIIKFTKGAAFAALVTALVTTENLHGADQKTSKAGEAGETRLGGLSQSILEVQKCINEGTEGCGIITDDQQLPNNKAIMDLIVSLLNKKSKLPLKDAPITGSSIVVMVDNNHHITSIEIIIKIPQSTGGDMPSTVKFTVNKK